MIQTPPNSSNDTSVYDGTKSDNDSVLSGFNRRFVNWAVPLVPKWLQTYHLTSLTYVWAALCLASGYFSQERSRWLWIMAASILGHYITDALDGEIGRRRNTGLVRWGFYTDHFGDFIFLVCILLGLSYPTPPNLLRWLMVLMAVWSTFFINAYFIWIIRKQYTLSFFRISSIEVQFVLAGMVVLFAIFGSKALGLALHFLVPVSILGLLIVFVRAQQKLWRQDLEAKKHSSPKR